MKKRICILGIGASLGIGLGIFLTQTSLLINKTPSLGYRAFICLNSIKPTRGNFASITNHPTAYFTDLHYTKRIMGLPGDAIRIQRGTMLVEDSRVGDLRSRTKEDKPLSSLKAKIIPGGYVFVSADNPHSFDSRYEEFGLVKETNITGICFGIWKTDFDQGTDL